MASAKLLHEAGDIDDACKRTYYAIFDADKAVLLATVLTIDRKSAKCKWADCQSRRAGGGCEVMVLAVGVRELPSAGTGALGTPAGSTTVPEALQGRVAMRLVRRPDSAMSRLMETGGCSGMASGGIMLGDGN